MPKAIRSLSARPYLLFIAAFITTALLVGTNQSFSASSLKLISPNGGQSYAVGQSVNIKWAKGNGGSQVKVSLLKGGKGYLVISKKTKNDGKLTWKVSSKLKDGSNYKIKIQSLSDTKVSDTSNKPFKITKAKNTKKATFKVTKPSSGKTYKTGKNMAIRWNKGSGTYVKITLLKGTKTHKVIHKKTKNDGKHNYTIPSTIKAGKNYKVKICSTKSTKSCATSKAFRISKGTATTVKVTYPNGGEKLTQGTTYTIKWDKGNAGNKVKIQLFRVIKGKHRVKYTISKNTKNKGKYSWKVPTKDKGKAFYAGDDLKIKVMAIGRAGKTINDLSDKVFSIVKASGGGSTGGGSTGGGSTGGGSTGGGATGGGSTGGGRDEGATEENPTGPPEADNGGQDGATCKVSPYGPFGGAKLEVTGAFSKSGDQYTVKPSEYATFKCKELCGDVTVKETKTRLTCSSQGSGVFDKKLPICEVASGACLHYPDSEEDKKQSCKWGNLRTAVLGDRYVKSDHYTVKAQWRQVVPDGGVATYALPNAEYSDAKLCGAGAAAQKLPAHTRTCTDGTWTPPPTLECPPAKCGDGSVKGKALCDEIDAKCVKTLRDIHKGETLACLKTGNMCLARCNKEFGSETTVCHIGCGKKWRECKDGIKYNKDGFDWTLFDETAAKAACSRD